MLSLLLWKIVLPEIIILLRHWGFFDAAEALAAKSVVEVVNAVKQAKVEYSYPDNTALRGNTYKPYKE